MILGRSPLAVRRCRAVVSGRLGARRGHGLLLDLLQRGIQTGPRRRAAGPDVHRRLDGRGIVQRAHAHDGELRACGRVGEQRRAAGRAEPAPHGVAAVGGAGVFAGRAVNVEGCGRHQHVDRAVRRQILAVPAPADAGRDRIGREAEADGAAEAFSESSRHLFLSGISAGAKGIFCAGFLEHIFHVEN